MATPPVGPFTITIPGPFEGDDQAFYSENEKLLMFYVRTKAVA